MKPVDARGAAEPVQADYPRSNAETRALSSLLTHPPRGRPRACTAQRFTTNVSETIAEATDAAPILCQVARQVVFHPDEPEFTPPVPTDGARWTALLAGVGPTRPTRSLRLPPLTAPRQRPSGAAKTIQTANNQWNVLPRHPD